MKIQQKPPSTYGALTGRAAATGRRAEGLSTGSDSSFTGYDSFDALYVISELKCVPDGKMPLRDALYELYELMSTRLHWSNVCAITNSRNNKTVISRTIWKLPERLEGESYLDGMGTISTWDEYAAIAQYIKSWTINLHRSSGFSPVRIAAQRRQRLDRFKQEAPLQPLGASEVGDEPSELAEKRIQFKDDLIVAMKSDGRVDIRYVPTGVYKRLDVTNRFRFVESLAKNGVTVAKVDEQVARNLGVKAPFTFVNLRGLREKTEWS